MRAAFSAGRLLRRLCSESSPLREQAALAAAQALRNELQDRGETKVSMTARGPRRFVGSVNAEDAAREFGTLEQMPVPWLAPVLPLALEPMRAAVKARVREIIAAHAGKTKAAARAASGFRKRKK